MKLPRSVARAEHLPATQRTKRIIHRVVDSITEHKRQGYRSEE